MRRSESDAIRAWYFFRKHRLLVATKASCWESQTLTRRKGEYVWHEQEHMKYICA